MPDAVKFTLDVLQTLTALPELIETVGKELTVIVLVNVCLKPHTPLAIQVYVIVVDGVMVIF